MGSFETSAGALREHLVFLLKEGGAHAGFENAIKGLPAALRSKRPRGSAHSLWEILEHMRLAQWDILEFSRNPNHKSPLQGRQVTGPKAAVLRILGHGPKASRRSRLAGRRCVVWLQTNRPIFSRASRGAPVRPSCAKRCSSPTITRII